MAARNAQRSISTILRENWGLWTVYVLIVSVNSFCYSPFVLYLEFSFLHSLRFHPNHWVPLWLKNSHIRCYITSWLSIGLAEITTRRILREKAEFKQFRESMNKKELYVPSGFSFRKNAIVPAFIPLAVVRMVTIMQWWLMTTFCSR